MTASVPIQKEKRPKLKMVKIYIMGREYLVPEGLTILKALEYAGYRMIRGVGCRAGFCGACSTVYRIKGDYRLYTALACQTTVQDGMYLVQLPFTPAEKPRYDIEKLSPDFATIVQFFPEVTRCVQCNTCTKVCPQEIQVMDAIQAILRGDIATAANLTFDCIACGICSMRCPAEIVHYNVFQLVRRLYGKYLTKKPKHLEERLKEIEQGKFREELDKLVVAGPDVWKKLYQERKIEP
mgnify:CR=1 FL=1